MHRPLKDEDFVGISKYLLDVITDLASATVRGNRLAQVCVFVCMLLWVFAFARQKFGECQFFSFSLRCISSGCAAAERDAAARPMDRTVAGRAAARGCMQLPRATRNSEFPSEVFCTDVFWGVPRGI